VNYITVKLTTVSFRKNVANLREEEEEALLQPKSITKIA